MYKLSWQTDSLTAYRFTDPLAEADGESVCFGGSMSAMGSNTCLLWLLCLRLANEKSLEWIDDVDAFDVVAGGNR